MPINPSIPLGGGGGGGFNTSSPFQILGQLYSMQGMRDEAADRRLQRRERERKAMDVETLDRAYAADKTREGVVKNLPGHLQPTAHKFFDDLEEAENKRLEANRKAVGDMALAVQQLPEEGREAGLVAAMQWSVKRDPTFYGPQTEAIQAQLAQITDPADRKVAVNKFIEAMAVASPRYSETTNAQANRRREETAAAAAVPALARSQSEAAEAQLRNTSMQLAAGGKENYNLLTQTLPLGDRFPKTFDYDRIIQIGQNPQQQAEQKRLLEKARHDAWVDEENIYRGWMTEGRQQADLASGGVTDKTRKAADQLMQGQLATQRQRIRNGDFGGSKDDPANVNWDAVDTEKLQYYNQYRRALKLPEAPELPEQWRYRVAAPKSPTTQPKGLGTRGVDINLPAPPPIGGGEPGPELGGLMPGVGGARSINPPPPLPGTTPGPMGAPPMGPPPMGGIPSSLGPQGGMGNPPFGGVGGAQVRGGTAPGVPNPANAPRSQFVDPNWPPRPAPGAAPALPGNIIAPPRPPGPPPAPPPAGGPQLGSLFGGRGMPFAPIEPTPGVLGGQASQPPPGPPAQPLGLAGAMPQVPPQPMNPLAQFGNQNIPEDVAQVLGNPKTKPGTYDLEIDGQVQVWDKDRYGNIRRLR